jgi:hypothetical protein
MHLHFEMTGGYTGIFATRPLVYGVTVEQLPEADRQALLQLVSAAGLLDAEPGGAAPPPRPDVLTYRLTITDEGRTRSFTFDDLTAPPAARPLLQHLQERAITERAGTSSGP